MLIQTAFGLLLILGVYNWRLGSSEERRAKGFLISSLAFFLILLCHGAGSSAYTQQSENAHAIIMEDTVLFQGADDRSESLQDLSGGVKIKVLDELDDWYQVILMNKEKGWIRQDKVEMIKL